MKKLFTILLSSFLVLGACSHTDSSDKKETDSSKKSDSKKDNKKTLKAIKNK